MADDNTLLNDRALEMPIAFRMNRSCMAFMRENSFLEIKALKPFNVTFVVTDTGKACSEKTRFSTPSVSFLFRPIGASGRVSSFLFEFQSASR
jgi:hypothetical protein